MMNNIKPLGIVAIVASLVVIVVLIIVMNAVFSGMRAQCLDTDDKVNDPRYKPGGVCSTVPREKSGFEQFISGALKMG